MWHFCNNRQMEIDKKYEILRSLPTYGPMYISISDSEEPFFSEGFVVRFYKSDRSQWVANFALGGSNYLKVFDSPNHNLIFVIAGGRAYVINPDYEKPQKIFGITISEVIVTENQSLIFANDINIIFFDNSNGEFWESNQISWDGIRNLKLSGDILYGESYFPTNLNELWRDFSINLKIRKVEGGTYNEFSQNNIVLEVRDNAMLSKKTYNKPWWKFW